MLGSWRRGGFSAGFLAEGRVQHWVPGGGEGSALGKNHLMWFMFHISMQMHN